MSKVISFISRKGGCGKTTNAINLSTMLVNLGYKVILIETDANYTLNTLRKMEVFKTRAKDESLFKIVGSEDEKVVDDLEAMRHANGLDFIIIDSAGRTTDGAMKKLCIESDAVIIPTSLTQNDLLVTYQTIEDLKPAREINPRLKILALPNRIHGSTKFATVKSALEQLDVDVLESFIPMKNIFASFSTILPERAYLKTAKEILNHLEN